MRTFIGIILFLSLTLSAFAQEAAKDATKEIIIRANDVLSAISGYQDSVYFRAVLVQGKEDADLYIFNSPDDDFQQTVYAKDIVITGIGGVDAYLTQSPSGSLQLVSENIAIGRHRWEQRLTIVYRDEQFVIGGYTYSFYDTLATDDNGDIKSGKCDINLLTGRGIIDDRPFRTEMKARPVQNWNIDISLPECAFD